jgi:S-DNA-T family DNA segregation ATPase FtsK/SpoIIIE
VALVVLVVLALAEKVFGRAAMPEWLVTLYQVRDFLGAAVEVGGPWLLTLGPVGWIVAAVWEGRDRTPGAGWLTQPDRDDAESWVDERMISRALAHLGIAPLNSFFKDGGELVYLTPAQGRPRHVRTDAVAAGGDLADQGRRGWRARFVDRRQGHARRRSR